MDTDLNALLDKALETLTPQQKRVFDMSRKDMKSHKEIADSLAGRIGCVICLVMFGLSSLISDLQGVLVQSVAMFDSRLIGRGFQALIIVAVIYGSFANISKAFMFADFGNGIVLLLNVPALILLGKVLRSVTKEWFDNKGDLKAIEEARKNK